jgi:hypothetical protein
LGGPDRQQCLAAPIRQLPEILAGALREAAAAWLHAGAEPLQIAAARLHRGNHQGLASAGARWLLDGRA